MRQEMPKLFFVVAFLAGDFPADAMRQEPCQGEVCWQAALGLNCPHLADQRDTLTGEQHSNGDARRSPFRVELRDNISSFDTVKLRLSFVAGGAIFTKCDCTAIIIVAFRAVVRHVTQPLWLHGSKYWDSSHYQSRTVYFFIIIILTR